MAFLLRNVPVSDHAETVTWDGRRVALKSGQILVWIGICSPGAAPYDERSPLIPAVLDTGFNGHLCLRDEHLKQWGGLDRRLFRRLRRGMTHLGKTDWLAANIWLHPNEPNSRRPVRRSAVRLELDEGIMVLGPPAPSPEASDRRPRLPLLGTRALRKNGLCLIGDFRRDTISLCQPRLFFWAWSF